MEELAGCGRVLAGGVWADVDVVLCAGCCC